MDFPWSQQQVINKPSDHNMILVDPHPGPIDPVDPFAASAVGPALAGWTTPPGAPSPADGDAQLSAPLDSPGLAGVSVTARYGDPADTSALVQRRFLFVDDTYLVTADHVTSATPRTYTWPIHGNAGGADGVMPARPGRSVNDHPPQGAPPLAATPYTAAGGVFTPSAAGGGGPGQRLRRWGWRSTPAPSATAELSSTKARNTLGQHTRCTPGRRDRRARVHRLPHVHRCAAPVVTQTRRGCPLQLTDVAGDRRCSCFHGD
jgi:hypothetical protein